MATPFDSRQELAQIHREYHQFFPEMTVVDTGATPHLHITTGQGAKHRVAVVVAGWYDEAQPTRLFPTFELLAMEMVPGFQSQFAEELYLKIAAMGS